MTTLVRPWRRRRHPLRLPAHSKPLLRHSLLRHRLLRDRVLRGHRLLLLLLLMLLVHPQRELSRKARDALKEGTSVSMTHMLRLPRRWMLLLVLLLR